MTPYQLEFSEDCIVCGQPLTYYESSRALDCCLCGRSFLADAACQAGHYVCDDCHRAPANEWIERVCTQSSETDPVRLAQTLLRAESLKMHGPEHHFLVPAVLLTAWATTVGKRDQLPALLKKARERAEKVPGGFCGSHGNCGAGVGVGIFASLVTGATPLSKEAWRLSNLATATALLLIAEHGGPRCCKRDTYLALEAATAFAAKHLDANLATSSAIQCEHSHRNRECLLAACPYYGR